MCWFVRFIFGLFRETEQRNQQNDLLRNEEIKFQRFAKSKWDKISKCYARKQQTSFSSRLIERLIFNDSLCTSRKRAENCENNEVFLVNPGPRKSFHPEMCSSCWCLLRTKYAMANLSLTNEMNRYAFFLSFIGIYSFFWARTLHSVRRACKGAWVAMLLQIAMSNINKLRR